MSAFLAEEEYLYTNAFIWDTREIFMGRERSVRGSGNRDRHGWQLLNNIYECSWCRVGGEKEEEEEKKFKRDFFLSPFSIRPREMAILARTFEVA